MNELWRLDRLSKGEHTALKRAAGTLALNAPALQAFYKADLCREQTWENKRYAAMCMACLWDVQDQTPVASMEECLKSLCWKDGALQDGVARRVDAMLETRWGDDDYLIGKLLNLVRMLRTKGMLRPDFEKLASDLRYWNNEDRRIQRNWLRVIYRNSFSMDENGNNNDMQEEAYTDAD